MEKLLTEVCNIQYGYPFDSSKFSETEGGIPLIRIRDVTRGYSETFTTEEYKSEYLVYSGDLLIGMDGEFNIARWGEIPALLNQRVCRLIPSKAIDKGYLYYYMPTALKEIEAKTPFVTVKHLSAKELNKIKIPLPPLDEQRKIAAVLDKVSDLIAKRRQQLDKLDEMVKARFVEMFGDPISNPHKWELQSLSNICKDIYGGGTPSKSHPEYFEGSIPWVSPKDMKSDIIMDSIDHITEEAVENSSTKMVPKGAVLMVIRSGILKHTLPVAIAAVELTVNQDMKAFIVGENVTAKFLMYYFRTIKADVLSRVRSVTADNIDFKEFQKRMVILPPIELQNRFDAFVEQTEKTKTTISRSLEKLETLKKALMQEYFG